MSASASSGLGRGAAVERLAPRGLGLLDLRDQRAALLGECGRRAFERGALVLRFAMTLLQRLDLPGGAGLAAVPFGALGVDRGEALGAQFGFAGERLRFAARFGEHGALRRDLAARLRKLIFQFGARRQGFDRLRGVALGRDRLVAARREAHLRFGERRQPRGQAARLALGRRMRVARRIGVSLSLAPQIARLAFHGDRGRKFDLGGLDGAAFAVSLGARLSKLGVEIGKAVLGGEAARRGGRRIRGGGEAVPAPQIAVRRHQPLAGLELRDERRPERAVDHADLREPPRQFGGRRDVTRERLGASGQRRIASVGRRTRPADRRSRIDRRFEIVAERRAERGLVALSPR